MYSYESGRSGQAGTRSTRAGYSSLASGKAATSKLFELSMDDFDDIDNMSDIEHAGFDVASRPRAESGGKKAGRTLSFDEQVFGKAANAESASSGRQGESGSGYERLKPRYDNDGSSTLLHTGDGPSLLSPEHGPGLVLELSQESGYTTKYQTPASYRAPQLSSDSTAKVNFGGEAERDSAGGTSTVSRGAWTLALGNSAGEPTNPGEYGMAETPALKPPPHPTQGSTVTTRWKRRGRLGLAKPKRYDPGMPSDDSTQEAEGDGVGFGPSSPPKSMDFLGGGGSSSSIDNNPYATRLARSPPPPSRSFLSSYGSMESEASQQRSFVSMDEPAPEFENTFHAAHLRHTSKSPPVADGVIQQAPRALYDGALASRSMDISDVSMNSNPRSRPQSPDADGSARTPASNASLSRASLGDHSGSGSRRTAELRQAESSDSKDPGPGDSARRHALSPLLGRARPLLNPLPASASSENISQRAELGESPKLQAQSLTRLGSAVYPVPALEKRSSAYGDSAMDISSRFQQYEKRMKEASPQYHRSPRERTRTVGGLVRSADVSMGDADSSRGDEAEQQHFAEPKPVSRRLHSASSSARLPDRSAFPEKSALPVSGDRNNFDVLRSGATPTASDAGASAGGYGSAKALNGQPEVGKAALQAQYTEALSQAAQQRPPATMSPPEALSLADQQRPPAAKSPPEPSPPQQHPLLQSRSQAPAHTSPVDQAQAMQPQPAVQVAGAPDPKRMLLVNGRSYQKISITGRGGSSKVYKAMSPKHEIFAIKRVSFSRADMQAIEGYINEILLLRKFEGNPYIIQLYDAEINKERGLIHMVMEFGETDLASVLKRQGDQPLGLNMIRLYWEQMLRAVLTIHDERVVHADLKPANYLLVRGSLKLIDFGIAKSIANDTTNIHRENQVGTVNYMSPEAIKETNTEGGARLMKLGRASDIWSLGIILYQMCYGRTPFAQLALFKKLASIPDPSFVIPFPRYRAGCLQVGTERDPNADTSQTFADGTPKEVVPSDLLQVMKACLQRDPNKRMSIPDLLVDPLLCPMSLEQALPSAMSQMLSLLKRSPQVLDQWDVSEAQNVKLNETLLELNQKIEEINEMNTDLVAFSNIWNHYQRNANLYLASTNSMEPAAVERLPR
ncbi:Dual-specificity kinase, spindle pole body (SPB) duplication and spindle checkpoint function [Coemansia sp. RSA 2322]|nr:Dual-specificity kinase, spindle pole body (SPB) duplication and spindle checkpoint function [Coemansia sp. RSA 2322]